MDGLGTAQTGEHRDLVHRSRLRHARLRRVTAAAAPFLADIDLALTQPIDIATLIAEQDRNDA